MSISYNNTSYTRSVSVAHMAYMALSVAEMCLHIRKHVRKHACPNGLIKNGTWKFHRKFHVDAPAILVMNLWKKSQYIFPKKGLGSMGVRNKFLQKFIHFGGQRCPSSVHHQDTIPRNFDTMRHIVCTLGRPAPAKIDEFPVFGEIYCKFFQILWFFVSKNM